MNKQEVEQLTRELFAAVEEAEKRGYRPTYFKQMLAEHGGYEAINRIVASNKPSDGFTRLWELGRLDLTCEAFIVERHWRQHFDPAIVSLAEKRLREMGYAFRAFNAEHKEGSAASPAAPSDSTEQSSANTLRINAFFRDVLKAPVSNHRTSWGAVDESHQRVFLRVREEDVITRESTSHVVVLDQHGTNRPGWKERARHLEKIRTGYQAYAVLCCKKPAPDQGIAHFNEKAVFPLSQPFQLADATYMQLGDPLPPEAVVAAPSTDSQLLNDLAELQQRTNPTTCQTLADARLGQGRFRAELEHIWECRCAVTGIALREMLRASHCKPWRDCDDQQRLDPHNGLLLTANLDALFDRYLISFDDDGQMLVSGRISTEVQQQLGLPMALRRPPGQALKGYLAQHRQVFLHGPN